MSSLLLEIELLAMVIGLSVGLYAYMAQERLRLLQEIRTSATSHLWTFSVSRGYRDPAVFRIHGETFSGLPWNLETGSGPRSAIRLELTFPTMRGKSDLAVVPRNDKWESSLAAPSLPEAREFPSGLADFDAAYKVLANPWQVSNPPVTPELAERLVKWPRNTVTPKPVAAWRDQAGFHVEAHLSRMSNWATIEYLLTLGEDMCAQLPAPGL